MKDSNVHFVGAGIDQSVFAHKNAVTMNSSREGIVLTGNDVTFENSLGVSSGVVASTGSLPSFATVVAALRVRIIGPVGVELRAGVTFIEGTMPRDVTTWAVGFVSLLGGGEVAF